MSAVIASSLACTVRGCGQRLDRGDHAYTCAAGHAYDIARSGYVNLLQPQDRKSAAPGDSKESVLARSRLFAAGASRALVSALLTQFATLDLPDHPLVVDLGSGSGDLLGALAAERPMTGIGIDLSSAAIEHAARRFAGRTWVVANADRRLPLVDHCTSVALSVHGRRNPAECARILTPAGVLIVVSPSHDDLAELRELVQGAATSRERGDALIEAHAPHFSLATRTTVRDRLTLTGKAVRDVLKTTYRGARTREAERAATITDLEVTFASDVFVFIPGPGADANVPLAPTQD